MAGVPRPVLHVLQVVSVLGRQRVSNLFAAVDADAKIVALYVR
jgi:hypothetical protein